MKRYGYHRTSTREQHLDRGIKEITTYCEQNNLELEQIILSVRHLRFFQTRQLSIMKS